MRPQWGRNAAGLGILILFAFLAASDGHAQEAATTHTIFINAVEIKGSTPTGTLAPPPVNPADQEV